MNLRNYKRNFIITYIFVLFTFTGVNGLLNASQKHPMPPHDPELSAYQKGAAEQIRQLDIFPPEITNIVVGYLTLPKTTRQALADIQTIIARFIQNYFSEPKLKEYFHEDVRVRIRGITIYKLYNDFSKLSGNTLKEIYNLSDDEKIKILEWLGLYLSGRDFESSTNLRDLDLQITHFERNNLIGYKIKLIPIFDKFKKGYIPRFSGLGIFWDPPIVSQINYFQSILQGQVAFYLYNYVYYSLLKPETIIEKGVKTPEELLKSLI